VIKELVPNSGRVEVASTRAGRFSLPKGEGEDEGLFKSDGCASSKTPHLNPLPLRRGEVTKVVRSLPQVAIANLVGHWRLSVERWTLGVFPARFQPCVKIISRIFILS
jgi:hypothetical protein